MLTEQFFLQLTPHYFVARQKLRECCNSATPPESIGLELSSLQQALLKESDSFLRDDCCNENLTRNLHVQEHKCATSRSTFLATAQFI